MAKNNNKPLVKYLVQPVKKTSDVNCHLSASSPDIWEGEKHTLLAACLPVCNWLIPPPPKLCVPIYHPSLEKLLATN